MRGHEAQAAPGAVSRGAGDVTGKRSSELLATLVLDPPQDRLEPNRVPIHHLSRWTG